MKRTHRIAVVCGLIGIISGCSTLNDQQWYQETKEASVKAADTVTDTTSKTFKRMQHYLAEKDVLQTFHDAGEHSEAACGREHEQGDPARDGDCAADKRAAYRARRTTEVRRQSALAS
jgi:hypothetical protein